MRRTLRFAVPFSLLLAIPAIAHADNGALASAAASTKPPLALTAEIAEAACPAAPDLLRTAEPALKDGSAVLIPDSGKPSDGLLVRYQGTCWRLRVG